MSGSSCSASGQPNPSAYSVFLLFPFLFEGNSSKWIDITVNPENVNKLGCPMHTTTTSTRRICMQFACGSGKASGHAPFNSMAKTFFDITLVCDSSPVALPLFFSSRVLHEWCQSDSYLSRFACSLNLPNHDPRTLGTSALVKFFLFIIPLCLASDKKSLTWTKITS